jgi:hypothetical protein
MRAAAGTSSRSFFVVNVRSVGNLICMEADQRTPTLASIRRHIAGRSGVVVIIAGITNTVIVILYVT